MNATPTPFPTRMSRTIAAALMALTLTLITANVSIAAVDDGIPTTSVRAEAPPSAREDCLAGRRRTGTSALRLGADPVPSCAILMADSGVGDRRSPGVQP